MWHSGALQHSLIGLFPMKNFFKKSSSPTFKTPETVLSVVSFSFDRDAGWQVIATTLLPNANYRAEREVVALLVSKHSLTLLSRTS